MSDSTNVFGGKKQRKVTSKKDKDGGAAIEIGSILAPAVLYGLRRLVDAKGNRSASPARRGRARRGGGGIFSSVPAPLDGGESIGDWAAASFAKSEPGGVVPATVAKPVEAGPAMPAGGAKPMDGGKRRKAKKGGADDEPMYGGEYGLVEGGKRRKARKVKKGGADDEPMYGGEDESMDGGKRRKAVRKVKKGGADDEPMYGGEYGLVEGGKRRKAKKGGDKDQDDDGPMDGGKKKRAAKKGGDKDQDDDGPMDGGKRRKARSVQKGGAMQLFQDQLAQINDRIGALLGDRQ